MSTCPYCNKIIEIKNSDKSRGSLHNHIVRCNEYIKYKNNILTKDILYQKYVIEKHSAKHIGDEMGFAASTIINYLKKYNIPTRGIKESCLNEERNIKRKNTCLSHFGYEHNFCKNSPPRLKMESKLYNKYGVKNPFQIPYVIDKIQKSSYMNNTNKMAGRISKIEKLVLDYCKTKYQNVISNKPILTNNNRCKYVDIAINNKCIEVQGNNTHANPLFYKPDDIIVFYTIRGKAIDIWKNEYNRYLDIISVGYEILYVWENEIIDNWELVTNNIDKYIKGEIHGNFYYKFN